MSFRPRWPPDSPCYTFSCIPITRTFDSSGRAVSTTVTLSPINDEPEAFTFKYIPISATKPTSTTSSTSKSITTSTTSISPTTASPIQTPSSRNAAAPTATTSATAMGSNTPRKSGLRVALPIAGAAVIVLLLVALAFFYRRRRRRAVVQRLRREKKKANDASAVAPRLKTPRGNPDGAGLRLGLDPGRFVVSAAEFGMWPALAKEQARWREGGMI